jgi:protein pelota
MKIIKKDFKHNYVRAKVENLDDLWYLSYIIEPGDKVKSRTYRKIKLGSENDRNQKVVKKTVLLTIEVEKVEFSKYTNVLRINGKITQGPDDIPTGSYHTINLEIGTEFSVEKEKFLKYQKEKLEEASKESKSKILIVVHDREEAWFAVLKKYGYEIMTKLTGSVSKKTDMKAETGEFFPKVKKVIKEYDKKYKFSNIIIASPGFWREYIKKILPEELKKKIVFATCSSVGENGIAEVIKRQEVKQVLQQERFASETKKVEELLTEISKKGRAEYGLKEIKKAVEAGAVSEFLITDDFIHEKRQNDKFREIDRLMKTLDNMQGQIHIISSEHEAGKKLDGLGGIGALLRYKLNY